MVRLELEELIGGLENTLVFCAAVANNYLR
jgi:hypothetical protein